MIYFAKVKDQEFIIEIGQDNQIVVNGETYDIDFRQHAAKWRHIPTHQSTFPGGRCRGTDDGNWHVLIRGEQLYPVEVADERIASSIKGAWLLLTSRWRSCADLSHAWHHHCRSRKRR